MTTTPSALTLNCSDTPRDTLTVVPTRDDFVRFEAEDATNEVIVCLASTDVARLYAYLGEILCAKPAAPAPIKPAAEYPIGTVVKIGGLTVTRDAGVYHWVDRDRGGIACNHDVMDLLLKTDGVTVTEPCRSVYLSGLTVGAPDRNGTQTFNCERSYVDLSRDEVRQLRDHLSEVLGDVATAEPRCRHCEHKISVHDAVGDCGHVTDRSKWGGTNQACICGPSWPRP